MDKRDNCVTISFKNNVVLTVKKSQLKYVNEKLYFYWCSSSEQKPIFFENIKDIERFDDSKDPLTRKKTGLYLCSAVSEKFRSTNKSKKQINHIKTKSNKNKQVNVNLLKAVSHNSDNMILKRCERENKSKIEKLSDEIKNLKKELKKNHSEKEQLVHFIEKEIVKRNATPKKTRTRQKTYIVKNYPVENGVILIDPDNEVYVSLEDFERVRDSFSSSTPRKFVNNLIELLMTSDELKSICTKKNSINLLLNSKYVFINGNLFLFMWFAPIIKLNCIYFFFARQIYRVC